MRVLHIYKTYYPDTLGGVEKMIQTLSHGLAGHGVESEVFCLTKNQTNSALLDGIPVHRCATTFTVASTPFSLAALLKFRTIAKDFDVLHYHFPYPFADILHFSKTFKKPSVVTYHSDIVKQKLIYPFYKPLMSQYLKSVSKIVATSPAYVESSPVLQNFKNKVSIIPVGLNLNEYPKPKSENVEKYKAKFGGQFFIFIGVLRYYKGLHYLIEAVRNTTIQIVIAGSGSEASKLKDQAMDMKNVHFLGTISDQEKVDLLQAALAFVFPSHLRSEAYGLSLIEAAMQKKPLISCEIGTGTTYINLDQETGFTTKPNSPEALRFAMEKLKNNPDLAKIMGEKAHQRYVDLFTSDMMVESYAKVYNSLI